MPVTNHLTVNGTTESSTNLTDCANYNKSNGEGGGGKLKESLSLQKIPKIETTSSSATNSLNRRTTIASAIMKTSLSMTSLPVPNNGQSNGHTGGYAGAAPNNNTATLVGQLPDNNNDLIHARMRFDSLKKKRDCERELWRRSWESGHSHSSYSLHGGSSNGKDDFWAALQPNYNYIMDTNLIDSCREAHGEIVEFLNTQELNSQINPNSFEKNNFHSTQSQGSPLDPRRLRRWLREMEKSISKAPTLSQAMKMKYAQLQKHMMEHSELYCKIISQARVVGACIRNAEKEQEEEKQRQQPQQQESSPEPPDQQLNSTGETTVDEQNLNSISSTSSSTHKQRSGPNLKGLEKRYHLLYLKAFEIQCMLESLLNKKEPQSPNRSSSELSKTDLSDSEDEEPVLKQARLSNSGAEISFQFGSNRLDNSTGGSGEEIFHFYGAAAAPQSSSKNNSTSNDRGGLKRNDDGYDDDDDNYLGDNDEDEEGGQTGKRVRNERHQQPSIALAEGFEADSEGSDCEKENKIQSVVIEARPSHKLLMDVGEDESNKANQSTDLKMLNTEELIAAVELSSEDVLDSPPKNVSPQRTPQKRQRQPDSSKFNRSNRKSKNCAIFYFKHLDTDGENQKGLSSQNESDCAFKSNEEPSSEDEWIFTNNVDNDKEGDDDFDTDKLMTTSVESVLERVCVNGNVTQVTEITDLDTTVNTTKINNNVIDNCSVNPIENKHSPNASSVMIEQCSKESIHRLVLNAENLVREEVLLKQQQQQQQRKIKTPKSKCDYSQVDEFMDLIMRSNSTPKKCSESERRRCETQKLKLVQEWLEQQPVDNQNPVSSNQTTDCEASGEYTESDCAERDSDSSEEVTDSVATCFQGGSTSQATSTEIIGGSAEPLITGYNEKDTDMDGITPIQHSTTKVVMRNKRRNSDRPWSVSSLSQLHRTVTTSIGANGTGSFSISESALHTLQPTTPKNHSIVKTTSATSDSKSSLKKRKFRLKRRSFGKRSDSGSDGVPAVELSRCLMKSLVKSESFSGQVQEVVTIRKASTVTSRRNLNSPEMESEEDAALSRPAFKLGSITTVFTPSNLGALATLSNYNNGPAEEDENVLMNSNNTATEDLSSEQAWDNYQEKYNSENYSEGLDTDAAKRLLEFGDDYRNFLDSQSDCCSSSVSAANNLDSLSPPRHRKFPDSQSQPGTTNCDNVACSSASNSNTLRRRRALEFAEYERRRKNSDGSKKRYQDDRRKSTESSHSHKNSPKHGSSDSSRRKSMPPVRPVTVVDSTTDGLTSDDNELEAKEAEEIEKLLVQTRNHLEKTEALRIRSHLLRPEDYAEIIATCQENINCLGAMLKGPLITVLSTKRCQEIRELLSSWESLLKWSENASVARQLQEEMVQLKATLIRFGMNTHHQLDSKAAIESALEEFQEEKVRLNSHRSTMLKLNSSVHSWVTRQENELRRIQQQLSKSGSSNSCDNVISGVNSGMGSVKIVSDSGLVEKEVSYAEVMKRDVGSNSKLTSEIAMTSEKGAQVLYDTDVHSLLKDNVGDLYNSWDEADSRINSQLEVLQMALQTWNQLETGLSEFTETLGKDKGTLEELKDVLEMGDVRLPNEFVIDVRQVSKLLSERIETGIQNKLQAATVDSNGLLLHPSSAILYSLKSSSNGSLSDSGISDGGCGSDGGLSERERRLGGLRRLAKQLESSLAPGSEALKSIYQRMEAAELELKSLQQTCRELLGRTTSPMSSVQITGNASEETDGNAAGSESDHNKNSPSIKGKSKKSPQSKKKNKKRTSQDGVQGLTKSNSRTSMQRQKQQQLEDSENSEDHKDDNQELDINTILLKNFQKEGLYMMENGEMLLVKDDDGGDEFDSDSGLEKDEEDGEGKKKKGWAWRVAKIAIPLQFALVSLFCVACLFEPQCCDVLNNFSMSFTPHLRYVRGPPPV